jgi:hypothetical protein
MLYREIINVGSEIHIKQINIICVQNLENFINRLLVPLACKGLKFCYKTS